MSIKIKVDVDRITLDDLIALEENKSARAMREILARFVVDETENYIDHEAGKKMIGSLSIRELRTVTSQFVDAMKGAQNEALPPNGSGR